VKQRETFVKQIELAAELKKVLMVHCRDAYEDVYDILKKHEAQSTKHKLTGIVIHSFIGNGKEAKKFLDIGCFLSFNGIVTYKPRKEKIPGGSDPGLLEAAKSTPLERIVLETDAPYLAPEPMRGTRNEPICVKFVAEKIAKLKGISAEEVSRRTTENTRKLFGV